MSEDVRASYERLIVQSRKRLDQHRAAVFSEEAKLAIYEERLARLTGTEPKDGDDDE